MNTPFQIFLVCAFLVGFNGISHAKSPVCAKAAIDQAKKLLDFHMDGDNRIRIDPNVKELPPITNPVDKRQQFRVIEVWGTVYKGKYRMRLIYFLLESSCVLMGQEILEYARL